jgi:hypothetical protein
MNTIFRILTWPFEAIGWLTIQLFLGVWWVFKAVFEILLRPFNWQKMPIPNWNEQMKLFAGAIDRVSTACLTTGVLGPTINEIFRINSVRPGEPPPHFEIAATNFYIWISSGIVLHIIARIVLSFMKEPTK